jgi:D-glucuronyl C5-epimerase C-terminus
VYLNKVLGLLLVGLLLVILLLQTSLIYKPTHGADDNAIKEEANRFYGSFVFNKNGVPYYNYSYTGHPSIGLQGSPHAVSTHALKLYTEYSKSSNESAKTYFINNVNWLVNTNMLKKNGSFSTYEFSFPWKYGNITIDPPWRSSMANAEALIPLVKAYQLTNNRTYLDTAKKLLNSFYVDVKDGGLGYKTSNSGWWFEQYASRNSTTEPRVLTGMIDAILDINEYYKDTNDTSAKFLFDKGIVALRSDLPKYDNNGTSFYDSLRWPANSFYRSQHVILLEQLYNLTREPTFKNFHDRWDKYNLEG